MRLLWTYIREAAKSPVGFFIPNKASLFPAPRRRRRGTARNWPARKREARCRPRRSGARWPELGIVWIAAHSPQGQRQGGAKFRYRAGPAGERLASGRRAQNPRKDANRLSGHEEFLPWWNQHLVKSPRGPTPPAVVAGRRSTTCRRHWSQVGYPASRQRLHNTGRKKVFISIGRASRSVPDCVMPWYEWRSRLDGTVAIRVRLAVSEGVAWQPLQKPTKTLRLKTHAVFTVHAEIGKRLPFRRQPARPATAPGSKNREYRAWATPRQINRTRTRDRFD